MGGVEAKHSLVKRKVQPGSSGVLASLTRRVHQIEATLVVEPAFFEVLVKYFAALWHPKHEAQPYCCPSACNAVSNRSVVHVP
eukprot:692917-Amphidinium_carterae.1